MRTLVIILLILSSIFGVIFLMIELLYYTEQFNPHRELFGGFQSLHVITESIITLAALLLGVMLMLTNIVAFILKKQLLSVYTSIALIFLPFIQLVVWAMTTATGP